MFLHPMQDIMKYNFSMRLPLNRKFLHKFHRPTYKEQNRPRFQHSRSYRLLVMPIVCGVPPFATISSEVDTGLIR